MIIRSEEYIVEFQGVMVGLSANLDFVKAQNTKCFPSFCMLHYKTNALIALFYFPKEECAPITIFVKHLHHHAIPLIIVFPNEFKATSRQHDTY